MRRALAVLAVPALSLALIAALPADAHEAPKTRVYVVSLDGLRPDEVALMPFLASLASAGTYYTEARAVMVAETIPNHVSMVTGAYPDRTGIVANTFPVPGTATSIQAGDPKLLQTDSIFTLIADQCPALTTAAVTSKDYLFTVLNHDRNKDGKVDADSNFANVKDPSFIPGLGLTLDERTFPEAMRVSSQDDPDFLFMNFGSIDRTGHVDPVGGLSAGLPTGAAPVARDTQLVRTDALLRVFVEQLKQAGTWDSTALLITADHSMDFSLPTAAVTLSDDMAADPLLAEKFTVAQNGGAALYSLRDRTDPEGPARLAKLRSIAIGTDGVDEALYRLPNPADGGRAHWVDTVHPDWHQTAARSGDLLLTVKDGRRVSEPAATSNPIPGNHGMTSTLRIPMIISGGLGVAQRKIGPVAPLSGAVRLASQAENVDIAPTAAWLLGVRPPEAGFDGRALTEAFTTRPAGACVHSGAHSGTDLAGDSKTAPGVPAAAAPGRPRSAVLPTTGAQAGLTGVAVLALAAAALLGRRRRASLPAG